LTCRRFAGKFLYLFRSLLLSQLAFLLWFEIFALVLLAAIVKKFKHQPEIKRMLWLRGRWLSGNTNAVILCP